MGTRTTVPSRSGFSRRKAAEPNCAPSPGRIYDNELVEAVQRIAHEAAPALTRFANSSLSGVINGVKAARPQIVARNDEDRETSLRKRGFSKTE